jgi:hypothetical protein
MSDAGQISGSSRTSLAELDRDGLRTILDWFLASANKVLSEWNQALEAEQANDLDRAMSHLGRVGAEFVVMRTQIEDIKKATEDALDDLERITEGG